MPNTGSEPVGIELVTSVAREVWENKIWTEATCMGQGLKMEDLAKWMAQFNTSICNDLMPGFDKSKYQKLFGGWLNKQKGKGYKLNHGLSTNGGAPPLKTL
jgi:hypothetical protein